MATEDLMAEINFIVDTTGVDQISYMGYSMSTAQMLYAVGTQYSSSYVQDTLAKVDVALLWAPCPYIQPSFTYGAEDPKALIADYIQLYENSNVLFTGGPDTPIEEVLAIECQFVPEEWCAFLAGFITTGNQVSTKSFLQYYQNSGEQAMLSDYFTKYGKSKYPKSSNFIDFSQVTDGPKVYAFAFSGDLTCPIAGPVAIAETMPTFEKLNDY